VVEEPREKISLLIVTDANNIKL